MKIIGTVMTDAGRVRKNNEDSCLIDEELGLFVVADGMGGHAAGEIASRLAVDVLHQQVAAGLSSGTIPSVGHLPIHWSGPTRLLAAAVHVANDIVFRASQEKIERHGMGTTLTAALINGARLSIVHVGDSRLYLFRKGHLMALTKDHSLVNEQLAQGLITAAQADASDSKNILTRAVGVGSTLDVDASEPLLRNGDWILLCTDGLTKMVEEGDIARVLNEGPDSLTVGKKLIDLALERGGRDNVTVAVGRVTRHGLFEKLRTGLRNWMNHRRQP